MKRENILITENRTEKRVAAVKFTAPGNVPSFDCSIHFGEEGNDVTMQNCIIKGNHIVKCSPEDTYDFEVGALIALMKMFGAKKAAEACCEAFPHETSGSIYRENKRYIKRIKELEEENETLKKEKEQIIVAKNVLYNKLEKENEELKSDKDKSWKNYQRNIQKKQDRINELERAYKASNDDKAKLVEYYQHEIKKLQHGYIDTDMIFCGGRQNGKQYTFLKKLFKSIPKDKVEAAYKEAYNTELPLWQKEVLNQMYGIYKESKEKIELQGFHIETKPSTKREEMWNDILSCGDCEHSKYVEVKKEDLEAFVEECNEKKIFNVIGDEFRSGEYWFDDDSCIFQIFRKPAGFVCAERVYLALEDAVLDYLPPMRWDLFKKGRRIIRVTPDNLDEFIVKCTNKFGSIMKPVLKRYKDFTHAFIMISDYHYDNKPTIHIMTPEDLVRNQHENSKKYSDKKIIDWEDVRDKATSMEDPYDTWR